MALNGTGIEFGKSEHDSRRITSRATTTSAHFILLGQRCGVQVVLQKVGRDNRPPPVSVTPLATTRRPVQLYPQYPSAADVVSQYTAAILRDLRDLTRFYAMLRDARTKAPSKGAARRFPKRNRTYGVGGPVAVLQRCGWKRNLVSCTCASARSHGHRCRRRPCTSNHPACHSTARSVRLGRQML